MPSRNENEKMRNENRLRHCPEVTGKWGERKVSVSIFEIAVRLGETRESVEDSRSHIPNTGSSLRGFGCSSGKHFPFSPMISIRLFQITLFRQQEGKKENVESISLKLRSIRRRRRRRMEMAVFFCRCCWQNYILKSHSPPNLGKSNAQGFIAAGS